MIKGKWKDKKGYYIFDSDKIEIEGKEYLVRKKDGRLGYFDPEQNKVIMFLGKYDNHILNNATKIFKS